MYLYCLVVGEFSKSEADDLEMALPRKPKKGVSNWDYFTFITIHVIVGFIDPEPVDVEVLETCQTGKNMKGVSNSDMGQAFSSA